MGIPPWVIASAGPYEDTGSAQIYVHNFNGLISHAFCMTVTRTHADSADAATCVSGSSLRRGALHLNRRIAGGMPVVGHELMHLRQIPPWRAER
jgi:hypothetical protein